MINAILILVGGMAYMFVGALIGTFTDEYDFAWIVLLSAVWPAAVLLYIPIKLAEIVHTKFKRWRLSRK